MNDAGFSDALAFAVSVEVEPLPLCPDFQDSPFSNFWLACVDHSQENSKDAIDPVVWEHDQYRSAAGMLHPIGLGCSLASGTFLLVNILAGMVWMRGAWPGGLTLGKG